MPLPRPSTYPLFEGPEYLLRAADPQSRLLGGLGMRLMLGLNIYGSGFWLRASKFEDEGVWL